MSDGIEISSSRAAATAEGAGAGKSNTKGSTSSANFRTSSETFRAARPDNGRELRHIILPKGANSTIFRGMSLIAEKFQPEAADNGALVDNLPPQVFRLASREREVATIIYVHGACTAKDVQALLSAPLSNGAVRSMLVRLIRKGLLERRWGKRGPCQGHVYLPAITPAELKEMALKDVADKYFGGSLLSAAMSALKLLGKEVDEVCSHGGAYSVTVPFELPVHRSRTPDSQGSTFRVTANHIRS